VNRSFWKDKRVFVTGHSGFKGSWLTVWLSRLGANVTGFSLEPPSDPSLFDQARVAQGIDSIHGDIRDSGQLERALAGAEPEIVFHLAAQSLVRRGYRDPIETYSTNVMGTAMVLDSVRKQPGVRAVVSVTSDKCYDNREWPWGYRECDPLGGKDPYSSSKAGAELVTSAYRASYFSSPQSTVGVASARAGNVIGGGDWAEDRLLPDLVRGFSTGHPVAIRCPGAVRPWQHVLEPLRGYMLLAERLWRGERDFAAAWNFGPEARDERSVAWVADRLQQLWGEGARWTTDTDAHPPEATYLKLDISKTAARLGWRPLLDLDNALEWIVDWHKAIAAGEEAPVMCHRQLDAYEELLGT
jgi:CDP-glucose 4,6-dehydratase